MLLPVGTDKWEISELIFVYFVEVPTGESLLLMVGPDGRRTADRFIEVVVDWRTTH